MLKLKKTVTASALAILAISSSYSFAEVSANISASSNYYFRGVTQTLDGAAVSGGIDYANESGFYAGTWVSNVDFGEASSTSYEADFYAGFAGAAGDFGYDVGYLYYAYPDAADSLDFGEIYGELSWQWLAAKASYMTNSQDGFSVEDDMLYLELNASFAILNETELAFHLAQTSGDTAKELFGDDYIDYGVTISKDGFSLGLLQTDLDDDDLKAYVSYSVDFSL